MSKHIINADSDISIPHEYAGLRALWASVMLLAISDAKDMAATCKANRRSAKSWIESDRTDIPNAFVNICDFLNISPHHIRNTIKRKDK